MTGANPVFIHFFSKGTLTHQIASAEIKFTNTKNEQEAEFESVQTNLIRIK
jgi:hypothetical protein